MDCLLPVFNNRLKRFPICPYARRKYVMKYAQKHIALESATKGRIPLDECILMNQSIRRLESVYRYVRLLLNLIKRNSASSMRNF